MRSAGILVLAAACHQTPGGSPPAPDAATNPVAATCAMIGHRTFTAVQLGECGLGPSGPVQCHWTIVFGTGQFPSDPSVDYQWTYSDVSEQGRVTCQGNAISSLTTSSSGSFDPATSTLTWQGRAYAP